MKPLLFEHLDFKLQFLLEQKQAQNDANIFEILGLATVPMTTP